MGFNKCVVPSLEELKKLIEEKGVEFVAQRYRKCDCLIGDSDAIDLLTMIIKENHL